jgi:hypothetical protein
MIFASVEVSWDLQTPVVLAVVILITTVVIAAVMGHHPISSSSANHPRNRLMQSSLDLHPSNGKFRIQTTPKSKSFKNPREKRSAFRREGNPVWVIIADTDSPNDQFIGAVLDRSTGGLCLSLPQEGVVGRFLNVRAVNAPSAFPWITVEVRHSQLRKDRWVTGCKFQRKFLWSELHTFG